MKFYETDFGIRFILLIRVKRVIIGGTGEGLGVQGEAPFSYVKSVSTNTKAQ